MITIHVKMIQKPRRTIRKKPKKNVHALLKWWNKVTFADYCFNMCTVKDRALFRKPWPSNERRRKYIIPMSNTETDLLWQRWMKVCLICHQHLVTEFWKGVIWSAITPLNIQNVRIRSQSISHLLAKHKTPLHASREAMTVDADTVFTKLYIKAWKQPLTVSEDNSDCRLKDLTHGHMLQAERVHN